VSNEFRLDIPVEVSADGAFKTLAELASVVSDDVGGSFEDMEVAGERSSDVVSRSVFDLGRSVTNLSGLIQGLVNDLFSTATAGESTGEISQVWEQLANDALGMAQELYGANEAIEQFAVKGSGLSDIFADAATHQKSMVDNLDQSLSVQKQITASTKSQAESAKKVAEQSRFTRDWSKTTAETAGAQKKGYLDLVFTLVKIRALWGLTRDAIKIANAPLTESKARLEAIAQQGKEMATGLVRPVKAAGQAMSQGMEPVKAKLSEVGAKAKQMGEQVATSAKGAAEQLRNNVGEASKQAATSVKKVTDEVKKTAKGVEFSGTKFKEVVKEAKKFFFEVSKGAKKTEKNLLDSFLALTRNKAAVAGISAAYGGLMVASRAVVKIITWMNAWRTSILRLTGALTIAYVAYQATEKVLTGTFNAIKRLNRATIFGARDQKNIDAMRASLSNMISQMEAMSLFQGFKILGFDDKTVIQAGKVADIMSRLTGQSRKAALEMLKTGQISDEMLGAIGSSQAELLSTVEAVQAKIGRTVSPTERATVAIEMLAKKTAGMSDAVKAAFPDDPFSRFTVAAKAAFEDLSRFWNEDFGPVMIKIANGALWVFRKVLWTIRKIVQGGRWLLRNVLGVQGKVAIEAGKSADQLRGKIAALQKQSAKSATIAAANAKAAQAWRSKWEDAGKAVKAAFSAVAAAISEVGDASQLLGQQRATLDLIRKLQIRYARGINALAIAGFKRATQEINATRQSARAKFEQFKAIVLVDEALRKERNSVKALAAQSNDLLITERLRFRVGERRFRQMEQEIQANQRLRAASSQVKELQQALAAMKIRRVNLKLTTMLASTSLRQKENALAQLRLLRNQINAIENAERLARKRLRTERRNTDVALQLAKHQSDLEAGLQRMQQSNTLADMRKETEKMGAALRQATGQLTAVELVQQSALAGIRASAEKQVELARKLAESLLQIAQLTKAARDLPEGDRRDEVQQRISLLNAEAKLLERQIELQKKLAHAARRSADIGVATILNLQKLAENFNQNVAGQLTTALQGTMGTLFSAISDGIAGAISGAENLGDAIVGSILGGLGDMALQFATFFATTGLGMLFTPGGQASGVGMLAAATGLFALAGVLKGASAAVTKPAQTSGASGSSATPVLNTSIPGRERERDEKPIQIFVSVDQEPWSKPTPQERYKRWAEWGERMRRSTGVRG
jgi:hypothetical protein